MEKDKRIKKNKNKNKSTQKILIALSTVLLIAGVFAITFYFTSGSAKSKYTDILYKQILVIDKANKDVADATMDLDKLEKDDKGINEIKKAIDSSIKSIKDAYEELKKINPPSKYKTQYDDFLKGIESNKKIFEQTNLILKNPKSKDLNKAIEDLNNYIASAKKSYDTSKLGKAYIKLPSEIFSLPGRVGDYASLIYNDYEHKNALLQQYTEYFDSMDSILFTFEGEKNDLNNLIIMIKNNQTDFSSANISIENKLSKLSNAKNKYDNLTIPPKIKKHKDLNKIMDSYMYYCQDFKSALRQLEEASSEEELKEVNMVFDELLIRYNEITKSYQNYKNSYDKDKEFYTDINNL